MTSFEQLKAAGVKMTDPTEASDGALGDQKQEFSVQDCDIVAVVVYQDQAEVTRKVVTNLEKGHNEVIVKGLSPHVDSDSIRVEGQGPATILEVTYQEKHVTSKEETDQRRKDLMSKQTSLTRSKESLASKTQRLLKQKEILNGLADTVKTGGPKPAKDGDEGQDFLSGQFLGNVSNFLEFYLKWATDLDANISTTEQETSDINEELEAVQKSLRLLWGNASDTLSRETSILLDVHESEEVTLLVSYVVANASWSPKYDIRAFSNESILKVQYHGMIQQSTGEDWVDAKISLSTAMPSIGGTVPKLGTMRLGYYEPIRYGSMRASKSKGMFAMKKMRGSNLAYSPEPEMLSLACDAPMAMPPPPPMEVATAQVKESTTATSFEVSRKSTIPSDNTAHKVTIALFDLQPTFEYQCIPRKAAHAFFKAQVKNTSPYAMLAGPANIFLDNNFIAKTELKAVSPSEDFECSLGVDNGVRVTYKPVQKFREKSGIISKTTTTTFHQVIEIKNTHTTPIKITVTDNLPKSDEEKIKVHLVEPLITKQKGEDKGTALLNKDNNIEWTLDMTAGATEEINLKYTMDHPSDKEINTYFTSY